MVNGPFEWLLLPLSGEKRICSSFDDCMVIFHECLVTRIGLRLLFSEFEVVVLKHLKVAPSQLHLGSWGYIRVIQLCAKHKSWKPSLSLCFVIFYLRRTSMHNFRNQGLIYFHPGNHWFDTFTHDYGDFLGRFLLENPLTLTYHSIFCYLLAGSSLLCRISYLKYWSRLHFNRTLYSYYLKLDSPSPDEVSMAE